MKNILKNWKLFLGIFILLFLSLMILSSLSMTQVPHLDSFYRQLIFIFIAIVVLIIFSKFDYHILRYNSIVIVGFYLACNLGLLLLLIIGKTTRGITGWFKFGVFNIQPVEFMKIALILILAKYLSTRNNEIWSWKTIITSGMFMGVPSLLAFVQPDLGSAVIMFFIWISMLIVSGLNIKKLLLMFLILAIAGFIGFKFVLKDYQKGRLVSFINPNSDPTGLNYNSRQSMIAIGSGRIWGKGLGWGTQTQLQFLPESKTDFIFASIAEELGIVGGVILLFGFGLIFSYFVDISLFANNNFSKLFLIGILSKIVIEMVINIGMNLGLLPVIGIALPFVSLGGSHLLADFMAIGLALNMRRD